ncbi:protein kinase [Actinacidiphila glaucinigra]|uniref:AbiJ-related protein n=1 Tax=Actinacidiphila glaucinigra TaxID=235986 RepID=UPI0033B90D5F
MEDWVQPEQAKTERILGQTAVMFSQRGDVETAEVLRLVQRLEWERTDDGFRDETNWFDYYWAAVFFVEERHQPRFTDVVLERIVPLLAEVAHQNGQDHVDRIRVRPALPEVTSDWRSTLGQASTSLRVGTVVLPAHPAEAESRITHVTRQRLFDALRREETTWHGDMDELVFLRRLYDLQALESFDPRFASAERDIKQHRYTNPHDWPDDWVYSDSRFNLEEGGRDSVLLSFLAEMLHPEVRTDGEEVERLLSLINGVLASDGYKLLPVATISGYPVYEGRSLFEPRPIARPSSAPAPGSRGTTATGPAGYERVRQAARHDRKDYLCPREPVPDGAQADVFQATHRTTEVVVALKKLHQRNPSERQIARMRREIEIGQQLSGHPHAMPILDFDNGHTWFVMPWAEATAEARQAQLRNPEQLRTLVNALASVLNKAHDLGWLHRDIKPSNILYLDKRWTLADWGIVRRPRGQTTKVGRTRASMGSSGFAAPELSGSAHDATFASDIYSVGRVIAWALTGEIPKENLPLLPPPGPWRNVVRMATANHPLRRPQDIPALLQLIEQEHRHYPDDPLEQATDLAASANTGDAGAAGTLLALASDHPDDYDIHVNVLTSLSAQFAAPALLDDPQQATGVLQALASLVDGDEGHIVQFHEARTTVIWLHDIAAYAAEQNQWDLLEETARAMCIWDGAWNQWRAQDQIRPWLSSLKGDAAAVLASVLRDHPESAQHFSSLAKNRFADQRLRHAVGGSPTAQRD